MRDYKDASQYSSFVRSPAYLAGYEYYKENHSGICQNPYPPKSTEAEDWYAGYCDAEGYDNFTNGTLGI